MRAGAFGFGDDSQKIVVERVAGVLLSDVLNSASEQIPGRTGKLMTGQALRGNRGEPGRTRTCNPLIKSQLLYH
jgi:hypothetical protein